MVQAWYSSGRLERGSPLQLVDVPSMFLKSSYTSCGGPSVFRCNLMDRDVELTSRFFVKSSGPPRSHVLGFLGEVRAAVEFRLDMPYIRFRALG